MDSTIQALWVAALRSGEYKQGCCALRDRDGNYCCLGVLCDLHAKAVGRSGPVPIHQADACYLDESEELPIEVMNWAGIDVQSPKTNGMRLSVLNDGGTDINSPYSFAEIADLIEQHGVTG